MISEPHEINMQKKIKLKEKGGGFRLVTWRNGGRTRKQKRERENEERRVKWIPTISVCVRIAGGIPLTWPITFPLPLI